jgi:drug/metabolite transporter (DMT)-like permease
MNVSYATALRQVNSLFGLLIGYYFLKEKISVTRFVGAFLILSGAVLIKINL